MQKLAALSDLEQLVPVVVAVGDQQIAVVRIKDEVYAFAPICTHRAAPLVDGAVTWKRTILCPWHLGTFSLRSGSAMAGPPRESLETYPVVIEHGVAYLDLDSEQHSDEPQGLTSARRR